MSVVSLVLHNHFNIEMQFTNSLVARILPKPLGDGVRSLSLFVRGQLLLNRQLELALLPTNLKRLDGVVEKRGIQRW